MSDSRYRPNPNEQVTKRQQTKDHTKKRYSKWTFRRARTATR